MSRPARRQALTASRDESPERGRCKWAAILAGPLILAVSSITVAVYSRCCTPPPPPEGQIRVPRSGQEIPASYTVEGSLSHVPEDSHVWLAVQQGDRLWPKEPEIPAQNLPWTREVTEATVSAGRKFHLVLFTVGDAGDRRIVSWLGRGKATGSYAGLAPSTVPGIVRLDVVLDLLLKVSCNEAPLRCIFPQLKDLAPGGVGFVFSGGKFAATFTDAAGCHRPTRSVGLRLTYDMSGAGFGGWGVHWAGAPFGRFDASGFSHLRLFVKGGAGGERFQVGLKDVSGKEVKIPSTDVLAISGSEWRRLDVPLDAFAGVDRRAVENFSLAVAKDEGRGEVCIDEIAFA